MKHNKKIKKILLDTNFLLIPYQFKIDIFTQIDKISMFKYGIFALDKTLEELKKIVNEQKGKNGKEGHGHVNPDQCSDT